MAIHTILTFLGINVYIAYVYDMFIFVFVSGISRHFLRQIQNAGGLRPLDLWMQRRSLRLLRKLHYAA